MIRDILSHLNPQQKEAVEHIDGAMLILAGAGSGKTKTLTTRLAYLIDEIGIDPLNTLTLTFTNKAASQMRQRALSMLSHSLSAPPLLCTFHKFGLLFLKLHIEELGRENNFVIIDSDDKKRILKTIAKEKKIDLNLAFIASEISKYKNSLLLASVAITKAELPEYKEVASIYLEYEKRLKEGNLVDFDDLLLLTYTILSHNEVLRKATSQRYAYIMVDEYQDTNELQFRLLELLASEHNNLCVVGDDDQSIYGWRGANIRNILEFSSHFEGCKTIKLETNYRSTTSILESANRLIEHNKMRLGKRLISHRGEGSEVKLLHSFDESMEAKSVAHAIKTLLAQGVDAQEIAVLYRINALSRSLEEGFIKEKLHFKLLGGIRFYERAEIKDLLSYFRVIANPHDDFSLIRIINKPKRGIGKVSLDHIKAGALKHHSSLYTYIQHITTEQLPHTLSPRVIKTLTQFIETIAKLQITYRTNKEQFIPLFEERIGLKSLYAPLVDGVERLLNIDELYGYLHDAMHKDPHLTLDAFLNEISLQSDQDNMEAEAITIMTIHASKGLEFEHLFVVGLEEEFFPLLGENRDMEEERRLGYVALTRAKSHLTLSYVDSRFYRGQRRTIQKSRFLGEAGLIKNTQLKITHTPEFKKGDLINHKRFGMGRVQAVNRSGKAYKLLINFGGDKREILSSFVQKI
jgi:DNA helicase-2/ATP-dependent DNA helicase PcrA